MKQFVSILFLLLCVASTAAAQTFTDHLRQKKEGQGTVTLRQSKAIDDLVNGEASASTAATSKSVAKETTKPAKAETKTETAKSAATTTPKKTEETAHKTTTAPKTETEDTEETATNVDMRRKVMRNGYKVDGYRVQAYAGGNTREDRKEAEAVRTAIKQKFPGQPVYVHFYSPRWICRVGNYRSYEEADWMLKQLRKMGYKSATIVKGKITVQY